MYNKRKWLTNLHVCVCIHAIIKNDCHSYESGVMLTEYVTYLTVVF